MARAKRAVSAILRVADDLPGAGKRYGVREDHPVAPSKCRQPAFFGNLTPNGPTSGCRVIRSELVSSCGGTFGQPWPYLRLDPYTSPL
jgi:hypothetical protein